MPEALKDMSLAELADHIVNSHHAFLRRELPRLTELAGRVAYEHGSQDPRLRMLVDIFLGFNAELMAHMWKEEQILFPMIRELASSDETPEFHCGTLANPVRQMECEHDGASVALREMQTLTDDVTAPEWASHPHRDLVGSLARLTKDMTIHIYEEDSLLFPRALEMEAQKSNRSSTACTAPNCVSRELSPGQPA
jgi:regulator of cell morphogenesis and NO signaling